MTVDRYIVYRYDSGHIVCRQYPRNQFLLFLIIDPNGKAISSISRHFEVTNLGSYVSGGKDEAEFLATAFIRDLGIGLSTMSVDGLGAFDVAYKIPYPVEVEDRLIKILKASDKASLADLRSALETLDSVAVEWHTSHLRIHFKWKDKDLRVPYIQIRKSYDGSVSDWIVSSMNSQHHEFSKVDVASRRRDGWTLLDGWTEVVYSIKRFQNIYIMSSSDTFWDEYDPPGDFTFDVSLFEMLGVELPILKEDEEFRVWADSVNLPTMSGIIR